MASAPTTKIAPSWFRSTEAPEKVRQVENGATVLTWKGALVPWWCVGRRYPRWLPACLSDAEIEYSTGRALCSWELFRAEKAREGWKKRGEEMRKIERSGLLARMPNGLWQIDLRVRTKLEMRDGWRGARWADGRPIKAQTRDRYLDYGERKRFNFRRALQKALER